MDFQRRLVVFLLVTKAAVALNFIFPGEGTSGTRSVKAWLSCHGVRTMHWYQDEAKHIIHNMTVAQFASADFHHLFRNFDAAMDTPLMAIWPYLFDAFPNASIVLISRPAAEWRRSRMKGHPNSPRPFSWAFRENLHHVSQYPWTMKHSQPIDEILYSANYALIRERSKGRKFIEISMSDLCKRMLDLESFLDLVPRKQCHIESCGVAQPLR